MNTTDTTTIRECGGCEDSENATHAADCPNANTLDGLTGDQWRAKADQSHRDRIESIERCDADGFLSQWASDRMAIIYRRCADVADAGGMIEIDAPVIIETGEVVRGEWVEGQYGPSFMAWEAVNGQRYFHPSEAKSDARRRANDAKKGIEVHTFRAPATVDQRTGNPEADHRSDVAWIDLGHTYGDAS